MLGSAYELQLQASESDMKKPFFTSLSRTQGATTFLPTSCNPLFEQWNPTAR